jgi:glucosamine-6-phosphate deaminase
MDSTVENSYLQHSGFKLKYEPEEKIGVIIVESFPELGRLAALRFLEWTQANPGGVISLPTGKTPEYFIQEVRRFLDTWNRKETTRELEQWGLDPSKKPDMKSLSFVQIDEFYPINPLQHNSFFYYVNKFYIQGFGLDPGKAILINCTRIGIPEERSLDEIWPSGEVDLTLRYRQPMSNLEAMQKSVLEGVDQWCTEYEGKVRSLGGIGFFLGGIGPDGHIGFNVKGSDFYSTTRLTRTNYETQAAAAQDLGGIEIARRRLVITIGLSTILINPECVAIIIAAGEAKSRIVADSIQKGAQIRFPATILHSLPNARFFLTQGAASALRQRRLHALKGGGELPPLHAERIVIDLALERKKTIMDLSREDFMGDSFGRMLLEKQKLEQIRKDTLRNLSDKIEAGTATRKNCVFLHTEPHHDDIMLGYLPGVVRHIRDHSTKHVFATLTSGFTSVTNHFMLKQVELLQRALKTGMFDELLREGYFEPGNRIGKNRDVWQYLDGVAADSPSMKDEGQLRRLLRNLIQLYDENDIERLKDRIDELMNYFQTQYPGRKDLPHIQRLKGMCREWEADCLWGYFGWHSDSVFHLRLGFYTGDIFSEEPTMERDVAPILDLFREVKPDVVSVALDPEGSGPDTHYKVLQAVTEALKLYEKQASRPDIVIWGYRNVWYRFHPCEANIFIPVSLNMFALQDSAFRNSFLSQKEASFPSYEYDGPFSELAQKIQVDQYQMLKTCLGRSYFYEHQSALIRATRGFVFIKEMNLEEFYRHSRELQKRTEARSP